MTVVKKKWVVSEQASDTASSLPKHGTPLLDPKGKKKNRNSNQLRCEYKVPHIYMALSDLQNTFIHMILFDSHNVFT